MGSTPLCWQWVCYCHSQFLDTWLGPCVVYMLRDMDIMEDLNDIRKVNTILWTFISPCVVYTTICSPAGKSIRGGTTQNQR